MTDDKYGVFVFDGNGKPLKKVAETRCPKELEKLQEAEAKVLDQEESSIEMHPEIEEMMRQPLYMKTLTEFGCKIRPRETEANMSLEKIYNRLVELKNKREGCRCANCTAERYNFGAWVEVKHLENQRCQPPEESYPWTNRFYKPWQFGK